ncbi:mitogen-activated protein kinase 15-like protein, partial [Tanacetum coccineum]
MQGAMCNEHFKKGDPLQVKVNKLFSVKTQLPHHYYYLNYFSYERGAPKQIMLLLSLKRFSLCSRSVSRRRTEVCSTSPSADFLATLGVVSHRNPEQPYDDVVISAFTHNEDPNRIGPSISNRRKRTVGNPQVIPATELRATGASATFCNVPRYWIITDTSSMKSEDVYHRDLKPKNILANANCKLKICDFRLARYAFTDTPTRIFCTDYADLFIH